MRAIPFLYQAGMWSSFIEVINMRKILLVLLMVVMIMGVPKPVIAQTASNTVFKTTNDVVLQVVANAKQINTKYTVATSISKKDIPLLMSKIEQLDNFYTALRTEYVVYGETVKSITFSMDYIDAFAVTQVHKTPALASKLTKKQKLVYEKAKKIVSTLIKKDMTPYQKELVINAYIVKTCEYDKAAFEAHDQRDAKYVDSYTPYGVLFNGKAVCDGYAQTASILFTMAGMDNYILRSADHAWNLVKVGDSFYHLDVTWNDTTNSNEYFNLTDSLISKYDKHDWKNKQLYPKAEATALNYYVVNKLVVTSLPELENQIKRDLDAKRPTNVWISKFTPTAEDLSKVLTKLNSAGHKITSYTYKLPSKDAQNFSAVLSVTY